jgi:hypothetical protein
MREILKFKIFDNTVQFETWQLLIRRNIKQIKPLIAEITKYKDDYNETSELKQVSIFVVYKEKRN